MTAFPETTDVAAHQRQAVPDQAGSGDVASRFSATSVTDAPEAHGDRMPDAGVEEFAEFGAEALDAYQALFEETAHLDHRTDDHHACELIGDLLLDLMHYAERRGLEFDDVLAQAEADYLLERPDARVFPIGTAVELDGPAAHEAILLGLPTRASVTGVLVPLTGPTQYYVRFLGETTNRPVIAADLRPAPPFPATPTTAGVITDPLRAEDHLIRTLTRIDAAHTRGDQPPAGLRADRDSLLDALTTWNNMDERSIIDLLASKIAKQLAADEELQPTQGATLPCGPTTPGQLANQGFPKPLTQRLSGRPSTGRSATAPRTARASKNSRGHSLEPSSRASRSNEQRRPPAPRRTAPWRVPVNRCFQHVTEHIKAADSIPALTTAAAFGLILIEHAVTLLCGTRGDVLRPDHRTALAEATDAWWALTEAPCLGWPQAPTTEADAEALAGSTATLVMVVAEALLTVASKSTDAADRVACLKATHHIGHVRTALR